MNEQFVGTMPMQDKHRFDPARLEPYLRERIEGFVGHHAVDEPDPTGLSRVDGVAGEEQLERLGQTHDAR